VNVNAVTVNDVSPSVACIALYGALLIAVLVAVGCGGSVASELSPQAADGRRVANTSGCASCHGTDGSGGVGPAFVGLYGSDVELADGSTVVADDEYLRRSITDPGAERVAGYAVKMPSTDLEADEIEAVLAYIRELGSTP
jgi:mono/diheme cytochrome c family protein